MEMNVIGGSPKDWTGRAKLMDDDRQYFFDMPRMTLHPLQWVRFFRKVKKCMILYWMVDPDTDGKLPPIPKYLALPLIRAVIKKPGGPAIVIEDPSGKSPLRKLADIVTLDRSDYVDVVKRAYFLAECGHPNSIYREPMQKERIQWLKSQRVGSTLEIGCSTGFVLNYVGGGVGVDIDELRLEYARKTYPESRFLKTDAAQMSFADSEFDTVMIPDILEHVEYDHARRIVKEACRVGKRLVITVPNAGKPNYDRALVENPEHRWFPTEEKARALVDGPCEISFSRGRDFIYVVWKKPGNHLC